MLRNLSYPLLLLAFAPPAFAATISAPLTFTAIAEPTAQAGVYRGFADIGLVVAPNPNSPIPGVAAEVSYLYSLNDPNPSCGACSWSFDLVGNPWWDSGGFSLSGDPAPQNVQAEGGITGTSLLPPGDFIQISLSAFASYEDGVTPEGSLPSITLTITPIFGSISDPPLGASINASESASWMLALIALAFAARYRRPRRSRR